MLLHAYISLHMSEQTTLRAARERAGLTQDELAARSGVAQATISSLERGTRTNPTRDTQDRLAKALGIAPSDLRFSEPEPEAQSLAESPDRVGHSSASDPSNAVSSK